MNTQTRPAAADPGQMRAGQYLTFVLADETYGIPILKVRELIGPMSITPVPSLPAFVKGMINLRGRVIPVVDLRRRFDMPALEQTAETCIIVVDLVHFEIGVIVDKVCEVLDIPADAIEDAPALGVSVETDFILGIAKTGGRISILLNIDNVLISQDASPLAGTATGEAR